MQARISPRFVSGCWANGWPSIDVEPYDERLFLPLLGLLTEGQPGSSPAIIDILDGYVAEFRLQGVQCWLFLDNWGLSLGVADAAVRDTLLQMLLALPVGYFDLAASATASV